MVDIHPFFEFWLVGIYEESFISKEKTNCTIGYRISVNFLYTAKSHD